AATRRSERAASTPPRSWRRRRPGRTRGRSRDSVARPLRNIMGLVPRVFVAGVGMTRIGRRSEPLPELMAEAARTALAEAGVDTPDAIVVATMNPEEFLGEGNFASNVATHMGYADVPAL